MIKDYFEWLEDLYDNSDDIINNCPGQRNVEINDEKDKGKSVVMSGDRVI